MYKLPSVATSHYSSLTLPNGTQIRARVTYLQPKAERWRPQSATVHILCSEWLEPNWHPATYYAGAKSFAGQFMPASYENSGNDWLFKGSFVLEQSELPAA